MGAGQKAQARKILGLLERRHADARIELEYADPFELLVATVLSAQCTDKRVNAVTRSLFKKYRKPEDYLRVSAAQLEGDIRPTGFFRQKAKIIRGFVRAMLERHGGKVPDRLDELLRLPGVGRKTANIVLGNAFGKDALGVDTHVKRVSLRLGLARSEDPDRIEEELCAWVPRGKRTQTTHILIFHGRRICGARKPLCGECPVFVLCRWEGKRR